MILHLFDDQISSTEERAAWLALLARAPLNLLETTLAHFATISRHWLRRPETGLMMVQARAGGVGERFNLGEITVTRCALRLEADFQTPTVGVAYVLGRSHRQAELVALADALLQDSARRCALKTSLLQPIQRHLAAEQARRQQRTQATRVEFFTVAREAGSAAGPAGVGE